MASLYAGLNARRDGFGAGSPAGDGCLSDEVDTLTRISDPRPQVSTHTHTGCLKRSWLRGASLRRTADLVFTKARVAVFLDGCFWHGCPQHHSVAKTNATF